MADTAQQVAKFYNRIIIYKCLLILPSISKVTITLFSYYQILQCDNAKHNIKCFTMQIISIHDHETFTTSKIRGRF